MNNPSTATPVFEADPAASPEPAEITLLRRHAMPDDGKACLQLAEALLAHSGQPASDETILFFAQAALFGEPDAHYYLALDCHLLGIKDLGRSHLTAARRGRYAEKAASLEHEWRLEDLDREAGVYEWDHFDDPEEIKALREDVSPSDPDSCIALGELLLTYDLPWTKPEALHWFIQAALRNDEGGGNYHLWQYWREQGNQDFADYHLRTAGERGHDRATEILEGPDEAESEEITSLRQLAARDDLDACYRLAEALQALDPERYREEAAEMLESAARRHHPAAQYLLALQSRHKNDAEDAADRLRDASGRGYQPAVELLNEWKLEGYCEFDDDREAIRLLEDGARRGLNTARFRLADYIRNGRGIKPKPARVASLYREAAEDGHAASMYELAVCYQTGYGVKRDANQARHWMQESATANDPNSLWALGVLYRGEGDHRAAMECFEGAARQGHVEALFTLGLAYELGESVPRDEARGRGLIAQAAEKDHIQAQCLLGDYYAQGAPGFDKDDDRAAHWYEKAADRDDPRALRSLGELTLLRAGKKKKEIESGWNYIGRAAKLGDVDAMMRVAAGIDSGEDPSTKGDPRATRAYLSLHWYQQAADAGNAEAQFTAGKRMLDTPHERERARGYLESAARQGHSKARALLDKLQPEPEPDTPDAAGLVAAAIAGDGDSQFALAVWHNNGYGVEQSFPLCYFWSKVLAKSSPEQAADLLKMAKASVPSASRKKLDREAEAWKPGTPPPALL